MSFESFSAKWVVPLLIPNTQTEHTNIHTNTHIYCRSLDASCESLLNVIKIENPVIGIEILLLKLKNLLNFEKHR